MSIQQIHGMSVEELSDFLIDRLWLGRDVFDTRLGQDGSELFIAAWKKGDALFRIRLNQAIGLILSTVVVSRRLPRPDPILPLATRLRTPQAVAPLSVLVAKLQHHDCGRDEQAARRHSLLLLALASAEAKTTDSLPQWEQQLSRVLANNGSPRCARAVMSHLSHIAPESALEHLPSVVPLVAGEARPNPLALLLLPLLTRSRSTKWLWDMGRASRGIDEDQRCLMRDAVAAVTHREDLAAAFAGGAAIGVETEPPFQWDECILELVPPTPLSAHGATPHVGNWTMVSTP